MCIFNIVSCVLFCHWRKEFWTHYQRPPHPDPPATRQTNKPTPGQGGRTKRWWVSPFFSHGQKVPIVVITMTLLTALRFTIQICIRLASLISCEPHFFLVQTEIITAYSYLLRVFQHQHYAHFRRRAAAPRADEKFLICKKILYKKNLQKNILKNYKITKKQHPISFIPQTSTNRLLCIASAR